MAAAEQAQPQAAPPKNKGMLLQIIFAVVNLGVMGYGSYLVYASTLGWENPSITEESAERELASIDSQEVSGPLIYTMEKFTVNLDGEPKRTIQLEVSLDMLNKEGFEEVMTTDNRARARDRIIRLLNDKSFTDLESIQGKLFLKDKISEEINGVLKQGVVKDVYFSSFVVQ